MNVRSNQKKQLTSLLAGLKKGDYRVLARIISLIENDADSADDVLNKVYKTSGKSYRIGITGPPGAGKSTLVSRLAQLFRKHHFKVGIIAVDPTSPFSGGAVLGDRIRMSDLITDPGIFIRSMATRGSLGGLSKTAQDVADVMAAAGMDIIIYETVGVGQGELDVARASDTTVVVLVPESGDSIQAMKAGLMEIADIFVINKSDRDGAEKMKIEIEMVLQLRNLRDNWQIPILKTIANDGAGLTELYQLIQDHSRFITENGILKHKREERMVERIQHLILLDFEEHFWTPSRKQILHQKVREILDYKLSPQKLVSELKSLSD